MIRVKDEEQKADRRRKVWKGRACEIGEEMCEMLLGILLWRFSCEREALWLAVGWSVGDSKALRWIWQLSAMGTCFLMEITKMPPLLSFHNSSLNLVRIEWWKQKLKTNPNRCLLRGTHQFWVMGDEWWKYQNPNSPLNLYPY